MHHDEKTERPRTGEGALNRKSRMEPAEGSRDNVNVEDERPERGGELPPESFGEKERQQGGGIGNRPVGEEEGRQENLPPRGERREDWKEH